MVMEYVNLPEGYDFDTKFDTCILAFCPDTDSWFATNERFFYYEYEKEFENEEEAICYFKDNSEIFLELEKRMKAYRPSFHEGGVYLDNIEELVKVQMKD